MSESFKKKVFRAFEPSHNENFRAIELLQHVFYIHGKRAIWEQVSVVCGLRFSGNCKRLKNGSP